MDPHFHGTVSATDSGYRCEVRPNRRSLDAKSANKARDCCVVKSGPAQFTHSPHIKVHICEKNKETSFRVRMATSTNDKVHWHIVWIMKYQTLTETVDRCELRVRALPEQEVRQAELARCANDEVRIGNAEPAQRRLAPE